MKLNVLQTIWMVAAGVLFATVLLDIAGVMQVPPIYWMLGFGLLTMVGWWIMPSLTELSRMNRRRP